MGTCQAQQNIDISLFIKDGNENYNNIKQIINKKISNIQRKSLKKIPISNNQSNNSKIIKKAYMNNNIKFNNTKKSHRINRLKFPNKINLIPLDNKSIIKEKSFIKPNIEGIHLNTKRLNHSFTIEKFPIDNPRSMSRDKKNLNSSFNDKRTNENSNILTERNISNLTSVNKKIIKDEDDTEKIILNLDKQINKKKELILSFDDIESINNKNDIQLYYMTEFNFNAENKYSSEKDFDDIIKSKNFFDKNNFTNLILSLPERKWYNELIEFSEKLKKARKNKSIDDNFMNEYLNKIIKIYNHFNHLVWCLSYYYSYSLFYKKNYYFKKDKINLPHYKSLDFVKGFEWKGLHIKILTYEQSKKIINEIKSLQIAFFDFLTLMKNNEYNNNEDNLLSNEIIFPLMSYAYINGIVLYVSVEIKKFVYDSNYLNSNIIQKNNDNDIITNKFDKLYKSLIHKNLRLSVKNDGFDINNDYTIDNSDNFSFDENILNEEIDIENYSKNDLKCTKILKNLNEKNLLKIFEEKNEDNFKEKKYKFILINIYDITPDLFNEDDKTIYKKLNIINCLDIKNEFKEPRYVNLTKVNNLDENNEMNILSRLIRIKATKQNIEIYKNNIDNIYYKIIYDNNKIGNKINEQITKFFVQFPLIQNYDLSRLLTTEYLNVGNLNSILNKYYKENTQEIPDRNIIIYRTKFKTKKKLCLILNSSQNNIFFPKNIEEFFIFFKKFCTELNIYSNKITNVDILFDICNKFGFNKKFLPFCLEYIENDTLRNIIQIYIYVSLIKKFFNYKSGHNLIMKLSLYERNKDDAILNSTELNKNNSINETQKKLFLDLIKIIFIPIEYLKEENNNSKNNFSKIFIENISFFIFLKLLKLKNYEKYINFKSSIAQLDVKTIFISFNDISRKNPFLFFDTLEKMLNIRINPFIKYKSSIDINNIKNITIKDIIIFTPQIKSFIDTNIISSYIISNNLLSNKKNITNDNNILSKIDINFFFPDMNFINSINYINDKLTLNKIEYQLYNEEMISKLSNILTQIFDGVVSYNSDIELILGKIYILLLLNSFFNKNDLNEAKNHMAKIKDILSFQNHFSFRQNCIINLLEGFLSINDLNESKNYYTKSLFLCLLCLGEIRNNNNKINKIIFFPVFQLIKILKLNTDKRNNKYFNDYLYELYQIINDKFNIISENNFNINNNEINKDFIINNKLKSNICETIIDFFYSKDNLIFNDDILNSFNIKLNPKFIDTNKYILEYLLDEICYEKNAPSNIVIFFGKLSNNNKIYSPKIIYSLINKKIKKIFSGYDSNFFITDDNKIFTWGQNNDSQLGIQGTQGYINFNNPKELIVKDMKDDEFIKNIYCAEKFSIFLSDKNKIYISGTCNFLKNIYREPKKINFIFEKEKIIKISLSINFILFLTSWGNIYSININSDNLNINKIPNLANITKIFSGNKHFFAISNNNIIFCWGNNDKSQLGINSINNISLPQKLILNQKYNSINIDNIFCGNDFTIFLNTKKEILVCGDNTKGQLGLYKKGYLSPVLNEQFFKLEIIKISCGNDFCIAMIRDSLTKIVNIWSWGRNKEGQLGLNSNEVEYSSPNLVPNLLEYVNHCPVDISTGNNHCLVLLEKKGENEINIDIEENIIIEQMISKYNKF